MFKFSDLTVCVLLQIMITVKLQKNRSFARVSRVVELIEIVPDLWKTLDYKELLNSKILIWREVHHMEILILDSNKIISNSRLIYK